MDDLIYSFLLQSGYPRASIVFNIDLLGPSAQVGSGMKVPTFAIVDPDTADPLAVIEVVDSVSPDVLKQVAVETGAYASRLGGNFIQGFVIRVHVDGKSEDDKVKFFRIWPNSTLQRLSGKNFPDLDTLRVARKLSVNVTEKSLQRLTSPGGSNEASRHDVESPEVSGRFNAGLYVPAIVLLVLVLADILVTAFDGESFLSVSRSILTLGAAVLIALPAALRYSRTQAK